jgi:hypothetical protein
MCVVYVTIDTPMDRETAAVSAVCKGESRSICFIYVLYYHYSRVSDRKAERISLLTCLGAPFTVSDVIALSSGTITRQSIMCIQPLTKPLEIDNSTDIM